MSSDLFLAPLRDIQAIDNHRRYHWVKTEEGGQSSQERRSPNVSREISLGMEKLHKDGCPEYMFPCSKPQFLNL